MQRWLQVAFEVPLRHVAAVEETLHRTGALSLTLTDPGGEPVLEPGPGQAPLWETVIVSALFPQHTPHDLISAALQDATGPGSGPVIEFSELTERDWIADWQQSLTPFCFGERLWICPPGHACPDPGGTVVELEPGLAFGTGSHATTAMCLEWLAQQDLRGKAVLDFGCGSGILAVAALASGAATAAGVDIDPQALAATRANAGRNRVHGRLDVLSPVQLAPGAEFDFVVANILANALIQLAPKLATHCSAGARIAMSGILDSQVERVRDACSPWFDLRVVDKRDAWVLLAGVLLTSR
jgi:ribosomal protein L11 methyltransferase